MNLVNLGIYVVAGYAVTLLVYSALTYVVYSVKYHKAKKSVKAYYEQLTALNKIYSREEKKTTGRGIAGGHKK